MSEHSLDLGNLLWFAGWLVAVVALLVAGLAIPLQTRSRRGWLFAVAVVAAAVAVTVLANVALVLHDNHIDLTREKVFTPSAQAMRVVDNLQQEVKLTYFYRSQDPAGRRTKDILEIMGRRNPLLKVTTVDPDKEPTLAQTAGVRLYNAAMLEAQGRRVLVQGTDEAEIAIGIQRVLRERVITVCFIEGHNELPMDNFEYHTHLEGVSDHSHGDAASKVIQTPGHGVGRMRRALEAQGYEVRKIVLATLPAVPAGLCAGHHRESAQYVRAGRKRCAEALSAAGRLCVLHVRSRLCPRAGARHPGGRAGRASGTEGGRRSARALFHRSRDGRRRGLRSAPDHQAAVDDLLPRRAPPRAGAARGRCAADPACSPAAATAIPAASRPWNRGKYSSRLHRPLKPTAPSPRRPGRACWAWRSRASLRAGRSRSAP